MGWTGAVLASLKWFYVCELSVHQSEMVFCVFLVHNVMIVTTILIVVMNIRLSALVYL
jgi:hypothetical protein